MDYGVLSLYLTCTTVVLVARTAVEEKTRVKCFEGLSSVVTTVMQGTWHRGSGALT